eukprot:2054502-Lingulodinium_polyedra.AAC.1
MRACEGWSPPMTASRGAPWWPCTGVSSRSPSSPPGGTDGVGALGRDAPSSWRSPISPGVPKRRCLM